MSSSNEADKVRAMLEHQENRLDERVKGLLGLQGLLFAALAFSWGKVPGLPIIFCIVGILATLALSVTVGRSEASTQLIIEWWRQNRDGYVGPPILVSQLNVGSKFPHWELPLLLIAIGIAWGGILCFAVIDLLRH